VRKFSLAIVVALVLISAAPAAVSVRANSEKGYCDKHKDHKLRERRDRDKHYVYKDDYKAVTPVSVPNPVVPVSWPQDCALLAYCFFFSENVLRVNS
jgi:hypothetical protein